MPSAATFTANSIIVTTNDGQRKTERAYSKLACCGRVIEDVAGLDQGEKILSIIANTGESLISLANNPSLYPGNIIDGKVDFDAAKTAVFDAIGISGGSGGGGGGGGGLTQSQTRDAVKDGLDISTKIEAIKNSPVAMFKHKVTVAHGTAPNNFTVGQEIWEYVSASGDSVWRLPRSTATLNPAPTLSNLELMGGASSSAAAAAPSNSTTTYKTATELTAGFTIPATTGINRILYNNSDRPIYGLNGPTSPTLQQYSFIIQPTGYYQYLRSAGEWMGEIRLLGDAPTTGFLAIEVQS